MPQYSRKLKRGVKFYYKFSYDSRIYFSKCIFNTKGEAKRAERELLNLLDEKAKTPQFLKREIKLSELIAERMISLKSQKSFKYCKENDYYCFKLLKFVGDKDAKDVSKGDINKLLISFSEELKEKGSGYYAVNSMLRVLKALFNYGIDFLDMDFKNPCKGVKFYPIDKRLKYIPTDDEINRLLEVCNPRQKLFIRFLLETGARLSEALYFRYEDIFDTYIVLYTRKAKNSNLTPRKVPRPACLKDVRMSKDKSEKVFSEWTKCPKFLNRKQEQLKMVRFGYHNLRHRYASLLSKQNVPIFEIMSKLGHCQVSTTQIYLQTLA